LESDRPWENSSATPRNNGYGKLVKSYMFHLFSSFKKLELDMDQTMGLSLEQQFSLRSFETQVERMSHEQAQDFLVKLYEQMMLRETMYKHFLKHEWGIESGPRLD
jgi:Phycobilisome degradation protein nblA